MVEYFVRDIFDAGEFFFFVERVFRLHQVVDTFCVETFFAEFAVFKRTALYIEMADRRLAGRKNEQKQR